MAIVCLCALRIIHFYFSNWQKEVQWSWMIVDSLMFQMVFLIFSKYFGRLTGCDILDNE